MSIVTIRGSLGSGAPEIGELIARRLNTDYIDKEIIDRVAKLLNERQQEVIEKEMPPGSLLGRIAQAFRGSYVIGTDYPSQYMPVPPVPLSDDRYLASLKSIIEELAKSESIVIRGRGSQFILKDNPKAFHVFVTAPFKIRQQRVMSSMHVDEKSAKKEMDDFDGSRREFIKRYFKVDLEDPVNYDLVINTEHLGFEAAASIVINAIPLKEQTVDVSRTA